MKSFRMQMTVTALGTLIAYSLVLLIALYSHNIDSAHQVMEDEAESAFSQISYTFEQTKNNIASCHSYMLMNDNIRLFFAWDSVHVPRDEESRQSIQGELTKLLQMFSWLDYIYLFDENGNVIGTSLQTAYSRSDDMSFPFFQSDLYEQLSPTPVFHSLLYSSQQLTYHDASATEPILYSLRQMVVNGRRCYILLGIQEGFIRQSYESLGRLLNGSIYLVDRAGTIASASDKTLIGTPAEDWQEEWQAIGSHWTQSTTNDQILIMQLPVSDMYTLIQVPMSRYLASANAMLQYILTLLPICTLLFISLLLFQLNRLTRQIDVLIGYMDNIGAGQLGVQIKEMPSREFQRMALRFNAMSRRIESLVHENRQIDSRRHQLEMETLRNQINPHFLNNSLNMIQWMAHLNEVPGIEKAAMLLSGMVRPLYKTGIHCTLTEELEYCGMFLELCAMRYAKRIHLTIDREGVPEGLVVLRLLLQPIVENAVVHGLAESKLGCEVSIRCQIQDDLLLIAVEDNGQGFDPSTIRTLQEALDRGEDARSLGLSGGGFVGLSNVARRIAYEYGEGYGIILSNREEGGACVKIRVPAAFNNKLQ